LFAKYLLTPQKTVVMEGDKEVEVVKHNLDFIKNKALLLELSEWNPVGNFDRISAAGMLMLLREDKLRLMGGKYDADIEESDEGIWNDPYWSNNYNDKDAMSLETMMKNYDY
jgi:hypothetical protein